MEEEKDWLSEGHEWAEKDEYRKAIDCFDKEIALRPSPIAYELKGLALASLGYDRQACECYDEAIKLNPYHALAYDSKGVAPYRLGEDQQALECIDKAIELGLKSTDVYLSKGDMLEELSDLRGAIECYDKAIEIDSSCADAYVKKGYILFNLGENQQALWYYDMAIEKDPKNLYAYGCKGVMYNVIKEYSKAIECWDIVIETSDENDTIAYGLNRKGESLFFLGKVQDAVECWDKAAELDANSSGENLLRYDSLFFKEVIEGTPKMNAELYRDIYIPSLLILRPLQITEDDECEKGVAHYTQNKTAQVLFFDTLKDKDGEEVRVPFRLYSITNSNDTQEGKTLFKYLFGDINMRPQAEHAVAFTGCFMFNFDSLNQFRLYGKDETKPIGEREGTGISIVMKRDFFCLASSIPFEQGRKQDSVYYRENSKAPLFRCIYIDPETNQVVSIGHRDYHTFYKTKEILYSLPGKQKCLEELPENIEKYKERIEGKKGEVTKLLEGLKKHINENANELNYGVVCNLLINLRYVVKHVAFKEEQECRIVKIKTNSSLGKDELHDEEHERCYINYLPITGNVSRIYFGPKASGMELFKSLLVYKKEFEKVVCYRSTSPLA